MLKKETQNLEIDNLDIQILTQLMQDATKPYTEIAKELIISGGTVHVRMKKLADNIRQAHEHAQDVHVTSQKISRRFSQIERVELKDDPNALLEFEEEMHAKQEEQNKDES